MMEIRHHMPSAIQKSLERARGELKVKKHVEMFERFYKDIKLEAFTRYNLHVSILASSPLLLEILFNSFIILISYEKVHYIYISI